MKKKPDTLRDQRREIIEKRKAQEQSDPPPSATSKNTKKKKPQNQRDQRREIIEKRKQSESGTVPPTPLPPKAEAPPPRTLSKGPVGDFPLPDGFVMPPKPPTVDTDQDTEEAPTVKVASPETTPNKKTGSSTIPSWSDLFPTADDNQIKQYKMMGVMIAIACGIALLFTFVRFLAFEDSTVASIVYIDVNPSVAIELTKNHKIIQATPQNAQGSTILGSGSLSGKTLEEGLEVLVGLFNLHGYIQETTTILATVEDSDQSRGEALSITAKNALDDALKSLSPETTTIGLWADPSYEYGVSAEEYNISYGKRVLVEELSKLNYFFQIDNLIPFSNLELSQLYASGELVFPIGLNSAMEYGKQAVMLSDYDPYVASIKTNLLGETPLYEVFFQTSTHEYLVEVHGYTGQINNIFERHVGNTGFTLGFNQTQAKESALTYAQKLELEVEYLTVKPEWQHGRLEYIVRFQEQENQYSFTVLGANGEVLDHEISQIDPNAVTDLGQSSIQDIAFADAGVKRSELSSSTFQRNQIDGVMVYEMTFWLGNREYFYQISGTGLILQSSYEDYGEPEAETPTVEMTETLAKSTALEHAGAAFSQVNGLVVGRDFEGNFIVEFTLKNVPYSYQISASTGEILQYEKREETEEAAPSIHDIGSEQAKIIALSQENLKEVMIETVNVTFEGTGSEKIYEITFDFNGFSHLYKVAGIDGELLHREKHLIQVELPPQPEAEAPTTATPDFELPSFEDTDDLFSNFDQTFNESFSHFDDNLSDLFSDFDLSFSGT